MGPVERGLAMRHLPDPELYGQKRRRRKYWFLGALLFGLYYVMVLLSFWR